MTAKVEIEFTLNGRPRRVTVPADMSTLTLLREELGLTGSKLACGEGECGACTILVDGVSQNACLMFAVDCAGRDLLTIEGLRTEDALHPMQRAFVDHGAIQCGFCMPGMIMQAKYLADTTPGLTREGMRRGLEGNVCRCTGYKKVFDAVADAAGIDG
ncbi:MAG: (2Fe-2S)-binding protein [Hyphomicrobiales bacterium]|nr:(2Fe-2S)-binding protein [Hyphomicrobiales bacterium]MCP5374440.1 (2Fe-2S)-binding protein [Hyphomicrobiales bacterium]